MIPRIPFLKPSIVTRDAYSHYIDRIDESHLYSNYGPLNSLFEARLISEIFHGEGAATTVSNATIGLILAISQVKRPGAKYALMPSFTFAATPLSAQWCGLEPYFLDVKPGNWCLDFAQVEEAIKLLGDEVAVVVPYAAFGTAMDLEPYRRLHLQGIPVVLDAAPCFGSIDPNGQQLGQSFPGMVVFSFHATKAFCIGEGGLVYSADKDALADIRQAGNFGFSKRREAVMKGLNSKISEYSAAIALATLDGYSDKCNLRRQVHEWYIDEIQRHHLENRGWSIQETEGQIPFQFMSILCPPGLLNSDCTASMDFQGIECRTYFSPTCHQQIQFAKSPHMDLSHTEELSRRILSIPLWERMTREDVVRVIEAIVQVDASPFPTSRP